MTFASVAVIPSAAWLSCGLVSGAVSCIYNGAGPTAPNQVVGTITVTATAKGNGPWTNCSNVTVDQGVGIDSDPTNNQSCFTLRKPPIDVGIVKTGALVPATAPALTGVSYTLTVTNVLAAFSGNNAITVTDVVPAGMTFNTATGTNWICGTLPVTAGNTMTCTYTGSGPTASNQVIGTIAVTGTVTGAGSWTNCAIVAIDPAAGTDTDPTNNKSCITLTKPPVPIDVRIDKTGALVPSSIKPPPNNETFSYTLTVTNVLGTFSGNGAIVVTDNPPAGLTYTAITANAALWSPCALVSGAVSCTYIGPGPTAPNQVIGTITVTATATGAGPWTNCANVAVAPGAGTDSNSSNNQSCVTLNAGGFTPVNPPPNITESCGVNVIFVVDESGSIASPTNYTSNVVSAMTTAAHMFNTNGAQGAAVFFNNTATIVHPWGTNTLQTGVIAGGYAPAGETNWQDAMQKALSLLTPPPPNVPPNTHPIIIFITDGNPDAYGPTGLATTDATYATNQAIAVVNQIYALGVPIIGMGIGVVDMTHLNALLGGHTNFGSYVGLESDLQHQISLLCPGLVLRKSMNPDKYAFTYLSWPVTPPYTDNITLTVTNPTSSAVNNVIVHDQLPAELTSPSGYVPAGQAIAAGPLVTWTIPSIAANATATLSFNVNVTPASQPVSYPAWDCHIKNFAQVISANGVAEPPYAMPPNTAPHLMANALTGPVHEPDEDSDYACMTYYVPTGGGCTDNTLTVTKTTVGAEGICVAGQSCAFKIVVTPDCKPFSGPVLIGDGVFSGANPVSSTITGITTSSSGYVPPFSGCPWPSAWNSTSTPTSCSATINPALSAGQSITFNVTLTAPTTPGNYTNCFVADGKPPVPSNFPNAYSTLAPIPNDTNGYGHPWGDCVGFGVAPAPGIVKPPVPPPGACPPGTGAKSAGCVRPLECRPPKVSNPAGTACVCPSGTIAKGGECVKPPRECRPPMVPGAIAGQCVCPTGTVQRGKECVKQPQACRPPMVSGPVAGQCVCPTGTVQRGGECVKQPQACQPPMVSGPIVGQCVCPTGTVQSGRECVKRTICNAPARLDARGACECPTGMVLQNNVCVGQERRPPAFSPGSNRPVPFQGGHGPANSPRFP